MLVSFEVRCPKCNGVNCRHSHWASHEEKVEHAQEKPYRCRDCSTRFMVRDRRLIGRGRRHAESAALSRLRWPLLLLIVAATVAVMFLRTGRREGDENWVDGLDADVPHTEDVEGPYLPETPVNIQPPSRTSRRDADTAAAMVARLEKAAERGDTAAMIRLGLMYKNGIGAPQHFEMAAALISRAAESGDARGMLELGRLYRDGIGVKGDPVLAYVWFNRAAAGMNIDAVQARDDVASKLTPEQLRSAQQQSAQP